MERDITARKVMTGAGERGSRESGSPVFRRLEPGAAGGETPPKKRARKGKRQREKNIPARLLVFLLVAAMLASTFFLALNLRPVGVGAALGAEMATPAEFAGKSRNILICFIDNAAGAGKATADVIMVANMDGGGRALTLLQIPDSTYVGDGLVYTGRIDALYTWGYKDESFKPGINALAKTIYDQFKLPIDNYLVMTLEGIVIAVDAVGGIEVAAPGPVASEGAELEAGGPYTLDGAAVEQVLKFCKNEPARASDRMAAQRAVVAALIDKLSGLGAAEGRELVKELYQQLECDLTVWELTSLSGQLKKLPADNVTFVDLPGEAVESYGLYGLSVFTPHRAETAKLLNERMRPYGDPVIPQDLGLIELKSA
jgi:anionic cell wall polymer biosynthesis LytR-Cps2A-Psr (LCP) family protein